MKSFKEIFVTYLDNIIIGIIAGLVLYYGLRIQSGIYSAIYIFLFALILNFIYSFSVWFFQKKVNLNQDTQNFTTVSKKESKKELDEKSLALWKDVGRDEYLSRRAEWTSADNKISSLLILVLAVFALYIQYVDFAQMVGSSQKLFYGLIVALFLISIILGLYGLFSRNLNIINFKYNPQNSFKDELRVLTKQYEKAIDKQSEVIHKKLEIFKASSILFFVGLFLTMLIKLGAIV